VDALGEGPTPPDGLFRSDWIVGPLAATWWGEWVTPVPLMVAEPTEAWYSAWLVGEVGEAGIELKLLLLFAMPENALWVTGVVGVTAVELDWGFFEPVREVGELAGLSFDFFLPLSKLEIFFIGKDIRGGLIEFPLPSSGLKCSLVGVLIGVDEKSPRDWIGWEIEACGWKKESLDAALGGWSVGEWAGGRVTGR
jgi:hypothetical protein